MVNWDVAQLTRDIIDNNWNTNNTKKPDQIELKTEDEQGRAQKKRKNRKRKEYIHINEVENRDISYNAQLEHADKTAACNLEVATTESRNRRENLFDEIKRILQEKRKDYNNIGNWDTLTFDSITINDESTKVWYIEMTVVYSAESRSV